MKDNFPASQTDVRYALIYDDNLYLIEHHDRLYCLNATWEIEYNKRNSCRFTICGIRVTKVEQKKL